MKLGWFAIGGLVVVGCAEPARSPADVSTRTTSADLTSEKNAEATSVPTAEPSAVSVDTPPATQDVAMDPLAIDEAFESAAVPKVEMTPAKELRAISRTELLGALSAAQKVDTLEKATKAISRRIGKPTWTENGNRSIWVARDKNQCHRLVLDADGQMEVESVPMSEWRTLSALARQNACTGEIRRGMPGH
ncbi:MAG TPA: hypothetical protein VM580_11915 [Labilithrix sp.]|jgi:hypothetical protein|nr:hypothetical protein [Labilithrix sp.]